MTFEEAKVTNAIAYKSLREGESLDDRIAALFEALDRSRTGGLVRGQRRAEDAPNPKEDCHTPAPWGYALFAHMSEEHGLTLTQSELYEIVRIAREVEIEEGD